MMPYVEEPRNKSVCVCVCVCVCLQNSSSVALLHKHLQLLLPHAKDIFSRSSALIKESSWNGSIREKLQGEGTVVTGPL